MSAFQKILSLILPETCRVCQSLLKDSKKICPNCELKIKWIDNACCTICGWPFESDRTTSHPCSSCLKEKPLFDWHRSCLLYADPVNHLIYRFKYGAGFDLLGLFVSWLKKNLNFHPNQIDYLIPVPLAKKRLRERMFNQSLELARAFSKETGIPVLSRSLRKVCETPPQTGLKRSQRVKNLRGAFVWEDSKNHLEGKDVLLIDDVYSTGSTLSACAESLKACKPRSIGAMTLAFNRG